KVTAIMRINRRGFLAGASAASVLAKTRLSLAEPNRPSLSAEPFSVAGKEVVVYTTANQTDHRISATDKIGFKHLGQPLETQICVFVDPAQPFQKIGARGGTLPNPSAKTFANLPAAKQLEILNGYFDANNGIGYTLARTNIHSCDFSSSSYTYIE